MKNGVNTSEFWLTLASAICATVLLALGKITPVEWTAVTGGGTSLYSIARGAVKTWAAVGTATPAADPRTNPAVSK